MDLLNVEDLIVGKEGVGEVRFLEAVNVHRLNFKKNISFGAEGVIDVKGELKKPAIVVLKTPKIDEKMEEMFVRRVKQNLGERG